MEVFVLLQSHWILLGMLIVSCCLEKNIIYINFVVKLKCDLTETFFYILLLWITLLNTIKFGIDKYLFVLNYKNELEIFKILNSFIKCYIKFYFSFLTTPGLIEGFRKDNDKLYFCKFWNNSYTISETILQATNKLF